MKNTMAFIGLGNRGFIYAKLAKQSGKVKITALCDTNENTLKGAGSELGVGEENCFKDPEAFFGKGKLADVAVISTPDRVHYGHCIQALKAGYDVLLEKPIAVTEQECMDIADCAEKYGRKVVVCHVLRYTNFYRKIKEIIDSGEIGDIVHISQSENVGWWHYSQSFIRGKWKNSDESSPMILAKCCHDLDIVNWLMGDKCTALSSFGSLGCFEREHAPDGSSANCFDCALQKECLYSAVERSLEMPLTMNVPFGFDYSEENIRKYLGDRKNDYGKCVYRSNNNVVDHQSVIMNFEKGATASLNMHAFAQSTYRRTIVVGTKGEIVGRFDDESDSELAVNIFAPVDKFRPQVYTFPKVSTGHGGGDGGLIDNVISYMFEGKQYPDITGLDVSVASHLMAFAAERSRLSGGARVEVARV